MVPSVDFIAACGSPTPMVGMVDNKVYNKIRSAVSKFFVDKRF